MIKNKTNATQLCQLCDLAQTFNQKRIILISKNFFCLKRNIVRKERLKIKTLKKNDLESMNMNGSV